MVLNGTACSDPLSTIFERLQAQLEVKCSKVAVSYVHIKRQARLHQHQQ